LSPGQILPDEAGIGTPGTGAHRGWTCSGRRAGTRWSPAAGAAALAAKAHVLAGDVHQQALAGDADALDRDPRRQGRQRHGDVAQRAEHCHRDAADGDHRDADAAGTGPGHP
jgi:hypothetical protein